MAMRFEDMLADVKQFHADRDFRALGGEDPIWRIALLSEEIGELAAAVTKEKGDIALEMADVMISLLGFAISMDVDIEKAFHTKMAQTKTRSTIVRGGHARLGRSVDDDTLRVKPVVVVPDSAASHTQDRLRTGRECDS